VYTIYSTPPLVIVQYYNLFVPLFQTEMSEHFDDIELEEAEPVDGSFLDVSLVEEVNSNSQENYCCGVCNKVFRRKAHLVRTVHLRFQRI
jgi:hypothetical protein